MQVLRRLLLEFWLPALIAVAWTAYNISTTKGAWDLKVVVNIFGPTFFLISWATGQFFRIRKQVSVENNLTSIESRVETVVAKLEKHTQDFMGYTTGADSIAAFMPMITGPQTLELGLANMSSYPVFDVEAELIDLDEPIDPQNGKFWTRHRFFLPSLFPSRIVMGAYQFNLTGRDRLNLNIFIRTRSQGSNQQLRIQRLNDEIRIAIRTRVGDKVIEQSVPEDFPGLDPANPAAIFQ